MNRSRGCAQAINGSSARAASAGGRASWSRRSWKSVCRSAVRPRTWPARMAPGRLVAVVGDAVFGRRLRFALMAQSRRDRRDADLAVAIVELVRLALGVLVRRLLGELRRLHLHCHVTSPLQSLGCPRPCMWSRTGAKLRSNSCPIVTSGGAESGCGDPVNIPAVMVNLLLRCCGQSGFCCGDRGILPPDNV